MTRSHMLVPIIRLLSPTAMFRMGEILACECQESDDWIGGRNLSPSTRSCTASRAHVSADLLSSRELAPVSSQILGTS